MRRALVLALLVTPALAVAQAPEPTPAERAAAWLATLAEWAYASTVVEGVAQAGLDPKQWPEPGTNAFARLAPYSGVDGDYWSYLRIAHAAGASGYDPHNVNGVDYVKKVREGFQNGQSGDARFVNDDVWAILALRAAGVPASDEQIRASALVIRTSQLPDGGWAHALPALRGSTDFTGAALAALRAAGEDMSDLADARIFLDSTLHDDGGHDSNDPNSQPNCQSTTWALHGYAALGLSARAQTIAFLRGLQRAEGGIAISRTSAVANDFCTSEAMIALAGARYPLPSFAPLAPPRPSGHARENVTLAVGAPFSRATWRFDDAAFEGRSVARAFPTAGTYPYRLLAEGPGVRARVEGEVTVLSARPQLGSFPPSLSAHRHANVTLDLRHASDADGAIARFEVDWGDGAWTNGSERLPTHAYALPGRYALRAIAIDDAGARSHPATIAIDVQNRAPVLAPLPGRVVGDRVSGVTIDVRASDPDGDALAGVGPRTLKPATLGNHTIEIVVSDAFGGEARANVTVEIVNLPPRVSIVAPVDARAGEPIELRANASDPDGPAPALAWSHGPRVALDEGSHLVRVTATDADGATTSAAATIVVLARDAPAAAPAAAPPEIRSLGAALVDGVLTLAFDASGDATVRWHSDAGDGERGGVVSPFSVELPSATWASATLEVTRDGLAATRDTGLLVASSFAASAPSPVPAPAPAPVVVAPSPSSLLPPPSSEPEALAPASLTAQELVRPTPAPAWWLAVAFALVARRGRRAW